MGRSAPISDLKKQNQEFSEFMEQARAKLKEIAEPLEEEFLQGIKDVYAHNKWDKNILRQDSYMDYSRKGEFSFTSINDVINQIHKSVFAEKLPIDGKMSDNLGKIGDNLRLLTHYQALGLSAAKVFIFDTLGLFELKTSTSFHSVTKNTTLAPGYMLHIWKFGDAFQRKEYFNNEYIFETCINVKIIYSFAQRKAQQDIHYLDTHIRAIEKLEATIKVLQNKISTMLLDNPVEIEEIKQIQERINWAKSLVDEYRDEVQKLVNEYK